MLQRLYIHNFRCLQNFEFKPGDASSALLIGKNGSGKSTVLEALKNVQSIARGSNRVRGLFNTGDFAFGRTDAPMRLELQAVLDGHDFQYTLALDLPDRFKELRVLEEALAVDGEPVYTRELAQVTLRRQNASQPEARFNIDWHLVYLPIIQDASSTTPLGAFREWLARMVLLAPIPPFMVKETVGEVLEPDIHALNLADWLSGLLAHFPAAYAPLSAYLQQVMPDLWDFRFERVGKEAKELLVRFKAGNAQLELAFDALSDGEKCFFLCGVLLAANQSYGPLFAFWDEPDNYLSISEVSHFVTALRRGFHHGGGQIWMTSHNEEAVRRFSHDNTWVLGRKSHLEPSVIRPLAELSTETDMIQALICGELEP